MCAAVCSAVRAARNFFVRQFGALCEYPLLRVHSRPIARKRPPAAAALGLRVLCGEFYLLPLLRARARRQFCATPRAPRAAHPTPRAQTAAAPIATAQELPRARWPGNSICQVCARYSRGARATPRALCSRLSTNVLKRPARAPLAARRLIYARGALVSSRRPPGRTCARCVLVFRAARARAPRRSAARHPPARWPTV